MRFHPPLKMSTRSPFFIRLILFVCLLLPQIARAQASCACDSFSAKERKQFEAAMRKGDTLTTHSFISQYKESISPCCQAVGFTLESLTLLSNSAFDESFQTARTAHTLLNTRFQPFASIESARLMGNYYSRKSNHDSSIYFYYQALELTQRTQEPHLLAKIYNGIAVDFLRQEQIDKGLEFTKKALEAARMTNDTLLLAQYHSDLGIVYWTKYDKTKQEKYLDSTARIVQQALLYSKLTKSNLSLTKNYLTMGSIAEARKDFRKTLVYTDTLLQLVTAKTRANAMASLYMLRGAAYSGLQDHTKAIECQEKALTFAHQINNRYLEKTTYNYLYGAYKAAGKTALALAALERTRFLGDSLVTSENVEAISRMEQKYNKKINEQTIKDLSQLAAIQTLELRQKNLLMIATAVTAALILLLVFLFYRQRNLYHQQRVLAVENKFLRFQLDPHFLSNALVSIQRFMLDNKTTKAAGYLSKFSRLMRQLLEYSREDLITLEEEIDLLRNYLELQKLRMKDKFKYEIKIDDKLSVTDLRIQPMLAQPFVENAVEHGLPANGQGVIEITFSMSGDNLLLEIKDNGSGISMESNQGHLSLSTKIIRERIELLNKSNKKPIDLQIGNVANGSGTHVQLTLPIYS
ncbi:MAG: histidine kinase [Cyclobacteriaceae bacterium]|nr:histidine kinase [Cyclobacteriaceae bacterium]